MTSVMFCLSISLAAYPGIQLSVCLLICPYIHLCTCLSVCPSVHLSVFSIRPYIFPSVYPFCQSIYPSVCRSACQTGCLAVHPPICTSKVENLARVLSSVYPLQIAGHRRVTENRENEEILSSFVEKKLKLNFEIVY